MVTKDNFIHDLEGHVQNCGYGPAAGFGLDSSDGAFLFAEGTEVPPIMNGQFVELKAITDKPRSEIDTRMIGDRRLKYTIIDLECYQEKGGHLLFRYTSD